MSVTPVFDIGIWNAWLFMIWPWLGMLAMRFTKKQIYQKASALSSEMQASNRYKIASYVSMIVEFLAIAYSIFLPLKLDTAWLYTGIGVFLLSLLVLAVALANFITTPVDEPVTRGAYRFSRHPLYLAISLIYLSVTIASASWIFLIFFITQLFLVGICATDEEGYCLNKYGDSYREYMNRTPRWFGLPKI